MWWFELIFVCFEVLILAWFWLFRGFVYFILLISSCFRSFHAFQLPFQFPQSPTFKKKKKKRAAPREGNPPLLHHPQPLNQLNALTTSLTQVTPHPPLLRTLRPRHLLPPNPLPTKPLPDIRPHGPPTRAIHGMARKNHRLRPLFIRSHHLNSR